MCSLVFSVVAVTVDVDVVVISVRKINSRTTLSGKFVTEGISSFLFLPRLYGMNVAQKLPFSKHQSGFDEKRKMTFDRVSSALRANDKNLRSVISIGDNH